MILLNGKLDLRPEPEVLAKDKFVPHQAVYTSIRTYGGRFFRLDEHLQRLQESARLLGFDLPHTLEEIRSWVLISSEKTYYREHFVKIVATPENIMINSRIMVSEEAIYAGVKTAVFPLKRKNVKAKSCDVSEQNEAYQEALERKFYEALLMNEVDEITEGSRSNILWIKNGILYWCDEALSGISQAEVLKLAQAEGLSCQKSFLKMGELDQVDELFLTQTSKGIVPIVTVNDIQIGNGKVGIITKSLMKAFEELTADA